MLKDFIKNDFELMISIYLFIRKKKFIFLISFVFNFQKSYLHLLYQENLLQNFNLTIKLFYLLFKKWMNFTILFTKSISIQF